MVSYGDEELLPLSALQHYLYCPRQCALIHVDGLWAESLETVEGRHLHENVDTDTSLARDGVRSARGLRLRSLRLGISGRADVVEFTPDKSPLPVEYKRGKPKAIDADRVQLCAQALCLEEMLGVEIPRGCLFYGRTRRRQDVEFSLELRTTTEQTVRSVRDLIDRAHTPRAEFDAPKCDRCSLKDLCLPKGTGPSRSATRYLTSAFRAILRASPQPNQPE